MRSGDELAVPRSLAYFVLRCCERLRLTEAEFDSADYTQQLRWLAYERLRQLESAQTCFQ